MTTKEKIFYQIVNLRFEIDGCREARMYKRIGELKMEIARLQSILRRTKDSQVAS